MEGTWKLLPAAGSMGCGDAGQGAMNWWSNSAADTSVRACIFDDSITFSAGGSYMQYMDGSTWLEDWQGVTSEQCGTPVAPHDGTGTYTWAMSGDTLTISGTGGHLGLPKAVNGGEISTGAAVPTSISYIITMINGGDGFHADIQSAGNGAGWWRFTYQKTNVAPPPPPPSYNVTLKVDASNIVVGASGLFAGGGVLGDAQAVQLTDADGNNIYEGVGSFPPTGGHYVFLNGPIDGGDWGAKEDLNGLPCADPNNWNDRLMPPLSSDSTVCFEFGTCNPCGGSTGVIDDAKDVISIYPNPTSDVINISSTSTITDYTIYNMIGNRVMSTNVNASNAVVDMSALTKGVYFVEVNQNGILTNKRIIKK